MPMPKSEQQNLSMVCEFVSFAAAAEGDAAKLPRFAMNAYTGGAMRIFGWRHPIVVDLAGMNIPSQSRPVRFGHDSMSGVGHTDKIAVIDGKLIAEGVVSRDTEAAREVVVSSRKGFPWQASIGVSIKDYEEIKAGQSVMVNGRQFQGPVNVVRKATLGEISFVDLGADDQTSARIAAQNNRSNPTMPENESTPKPDVTNTTPPPVQAAANLEAEAVQKVREATAKEVARINEIRALCAGNHADIEANAIKDGWTKDQTELAILRAKRPTNEPTRMNFGALPNDVTPHRVLEAAALMSSRQISDADLVRSHGQPTLDVAARRYRGSLGLQELLLEAAWLNGYSGRTFRDTRGILQAAFSTSDISGILSNVANKFLLQGFFGVESTWRIIAAVRNVSDFKTVTSYRLTGNESYEQVGPDGEIKHGTLGEESFTNKADTYAKMLAVTRTDIINDDLGALTTAPRKLGRGSALKLNSVFWAAWLDDAAFFYTNDTNKNYLSGATTNLSSAGMKLAIAKFRRQVDPESNPLGIEPRIVLAPPELEEPLLSLNASVTINTGGAATTEKVPNANIYGGRFVPAISSYLTATKVWYLLANPMDLAAIEVAFLNGQESPTIEQSNADFNTLGIQMRGYHDFGVGKQDPRAALKVKGEA